MLAKDMWAAYRAINSTIGDDIDAWSFGAEPDLLAKLVFDGTKTATTSAYDLYAVDNEPLPQAGTYDVVLDSQGEAICIIEITKVYTIAFKDVTADHAYKEGEGDRSLAYWRQVHEGLFTEWLAGEGFDFTEDSLVVCEEFKVVYPEKGE